MPSTEVVTLRISFDVDNDSPMLSWSMKVGDETISPYKGTYTGSVQFYAEDEVALVVVGHGRATSFKSFQVVDCCLVTVPQVVYRRVGRPTRYAQPSPFVQVAGASYMFSNDFSSHSVMNDEVRTVEQHWKETLNIASSLGRWDMSLVLTVKILRGLQDAPEVRVFRFDPETQVGNGTRPRIALTESQEENLV